MAFFSDNFTDTDGTLLQSHTPDTGTSWTRLFGTTNTNAEINSNQCRSDGDLNAGVIYTADATYPSADYDITCTLVSIVANNDRPIYLMVRVQDQENMYAVRLETTASESSLYKKVSGTWTAVGSLFTKPANGSVIKLEIIGTALKFYDDGVELASATVSDHSSAGKAGIGFGGGAELVTTTDDGSTSNIIDTLTVNDLAAGGTEYTQSVSGGITPAGTLLKSTSKILGGTLSSSGTVTTSRGYTRSFDGSLTPSGSLSRSALKALAGTVSSAGSLIRDISKNVAGTLSSSGAISTVRVYILDLAGSLSPGGTLSKITSKLLGGSLSPAGALSKIASKLLSGALSSTGELETTKTFLQVVSGTLTSSGALIRDTLKIVGGSLSPSGVLSKITAKVFGGSLSVNGSVNKLISKTLSGVLSLAGTLTGVLASLSYVSARIFKPKRGVISTSGRKTVSVKNDPIESDAHRGDK